MFVVVTTIKENMFMNIVLGFFKGMPYRLGTSWLWYGLLYLLLIFSLSHIKLNAVFPLRTLAAELLFFFLWGVVLVLRHLVQNAYENTPEKIRNHSGFTPSMLLVIAGAMLPLLFGDPRTSSAVV